MNKIVAFYSATWFGVGLLPSIIGPAMAATYGSFGAIPLCLLALWIASKYGILIYGALIVVVFLFGIWSVPIAEKMLGPTIDNRGKTRSKDQNQIVIDEVLGMLFACLPLTLVTFQFWTMIAWSVLAFFVFRFFDIFKKFSPGARYFDRMQNAIGVMLDDVVAGLWSALVIFLVIWFV